MGMFKRMHEIEESQFVVDPNNSSMRQSIRDEALKRAGEIGTAGVQGRTDNLDETDGERDGNSSVLPSLTLHRMRDGHGVVGHGGKLLGVIPHAHFLQHAAKHKDERDGGHATEGHNTAASEIVRRTKALMRDNPRLNYSQAHMSVLASDSQLARQYNAEGRKILL